MNRSLARFAWSVLAYNLAVILWGAFVRASGSGAGCGAHWPLCNGEVVPRSPTSATLIEYSHRLTSGLALVAVVVLLVWTWRACPRRHPARAAAVASLVFILAEAAVGAGLVLFELVADNATMARAMFMAVHLVNTFLLVAALTLTAWWSSGGPAVAPRRRPGAALVWIALALGVLLSGTSGAVAALGDTLYPASSHAEGLSQTLSSSSHVLLRLRALHPLIAVTAGAMLMLLATRLPAAGDTRARRFAQATLLLAALQLMGGLINLLLLAPVWMQIVHLLLADLLWIVLVLLGATVLAHPVGAPLPETRAAAVT